MASIKSVENFIESYDSSLVINELKIKSYGIVIRYSLESVPVNLDVNNNIENGEWALWDDRYDVITLHRVNRASVQDVQGLGSKHGTRTTYDIDLIAWAKTDSIKQMCLYESMIAYLYAGGAIVDSAEFDVAALEKREFIQNSLSVDSVLLSIKYKLVINKDYCLTDCNFKQC